MPKQGMQFTMDFSSLNATIGAIQGVDDELRGQAYMDDLIESAHAVVADEFDMQTAAYAAASGTLGHMYEWGTAGINTGRTTRRMNPLSPEAKLWRHKLTGSGKNMAADFDFLPSKVPVPQPTTEKNGIAQRYLRKLKGKHIFWNKAFVMESGTTVTIRPKNASKLFIPHMGRPPATARPQDIARGFTMYGGTVTFSPGARSQGSFTAYWNAFWETRGAAAMQEHAERAFSTDLQKVMAAAAKTTGPMGLPSASRISAQVSAGAKKAKTELRASASARARGEA